MLQRIKHNFFNWSRGTPIPPNDIEGIATLSFVDEDGKQAEVQGCIVRNNFHLKQFLCKVDEKYDTVEYFAYFKTEEASCPAFKRVLIAVVDSTQSSNDMIACKVDNLAVHEKIIRVEDGHAFIPCESPKFNESKFLRKYSKVKAVMDIDQEYSSITSQGDFKLYGLGKDEEESGLVLVCLDLKRVDNNSFLLDGNVYDKLVDGPLLYANKTTVVGYCTKNQQKIAIHLFGTKGPIEACKQSKGDQSESASESGACKQPNTDQSASALESSLESSNPKNSDQEIIAENVSSNFQPTAPLEEKYEDTDSNGDGAVDVKNSCEKTPDDRLLVKILESQESKSVSENSFHIREASEEEEASNLTHSFHSQEASEEEEASSVASSFHSQGSSNEASGNARSTQKEPIERGISTSDLPQSPPPNASGYVHSGTQEEGAAGEGMILRKLQNVTLCELCEKNPTLIQDVSLIFDDKSQGKKRTLRSVSTLAEKLSAPPIIINRCDSNYNHNPALELFKLPDISMVKVQDLCDALKSIQRSDLAAMIVEKVKEISNIEEQDMLREVDVVLLSDSSYATLIEEVTTNLNSSTNGHFNWRRLGKKFKIEDRVLDLIEYGTNPAERFLVDYAYSALPARDLQLKQLYQHMAITCGRKDEFSILFKKYDINKDSTNSMKSVFRPNSNQMDELCKLLNVKSHCKNWQHLADLWGIPPEIYFSFIPETAESPTRILLNWLMMAHPHFTVFDLCVYLGDLKRNDVKDELDKRLILYGRARAII